MTNAYKDLQTEVVTLRVVKASQLLWLEWMERATEGMDDSDLVIITTRYMANSYYLVAIQPLLTDQYRWMTRKGD